MGNHKDVYQAINSVFHVSPGRPIPIDTRMRYGKRSLLPELCRQCGYKIGAEIGVRTAKFAAMFCDVGIKMYCIDPWLPVPNYSQRRQDIHYKQACDRLAGRDAVMIKKISMDALDDVPKLDFIHIDGRHEFDWVIRDLIDWCPKVRSGGLVILHDYHLSGVKRAIEAYTLAHRVEDWFVLKDHQPTVFWVVA